MTGLERLARALYDRPPYESDLNGPDAAILHDAATAINVLNHEIQALRTALAENHVEMDCITALRNENRELRDYRAMK